MSALWEESTGDSQIAIAVLDGPVDRTNPSLIRAAIDQYSLDGNALVERSCSFHHGTEIASIIFGQHDAGAIGIAPGCKGLSIPVFECFPVGSVGAAQSDLAAAIGLARRLGAKVVNISAGQQTRGYDADAELLNAVRDCATNGVLIVAAAGNDGCNCLHVPAALPNVLSVGAMTSAGRPLASSNWGAAYQASGILAPGQNIPVAAAGGDVGLRTGTSYATAVVSGVVGLLLSRELALGRAAAPFVIRDALLNTAVGCDSDETDCRRFLAGRLNIPGAMCYLDRGSVSMTDESQIDASNLHGTDPQTMSPTEQQPCIHDHAQRAPNAINETIDTRPEAWPSDLSTPAVEPAACAACRGEQQLVYALGQLGCDFGTEAGLDAFRQEMSRSLAKNGEKPHPLNDKQLIEFLDKPETEPWHREALLWTLNQHGSPIYVIQPEGPFGAVTYKRLLEIFHDQVIGCEETAKPESASKSQDSSVQEAFQTEPDGNDKLVYSEQVAVPGIISSQATLLNGQTVPVIKPDPRGLCDWNKKKLIDALKDCVPTASEDQGPDQQQQDPRQQDQGLSPEQTDEIDRFLNRIYYELANRGVTPQERALNYAGTNLFELCGVLSKLGNTKRTLDTIQVERSQICRPGSDCWDIVLSFFDPNQLQPVCKIFRYTVDVSDVIPVTVGTLRCWEARTR